MLHSCNNILAVLMQQQYTSCTHVNIPVAHQNIKRSNLLCHIFYRIKMLENEILYEITI
ncbi:hypothetical protein C1646_690536 [Rhizophagus diaphanus]|nr:hypothetical protein C1646_690536 [Rhizophagus diaphanus] [Rhizophagus sp. MUCL 43196]